ncbi:thiamine pyrophosphate-binding protein [Candidatus Bathyarchaeota archaeon]|nr:MAG: thiamine pyrophosphate-binding protein [Candidatus Bathyarchaeota archaeon]
MDVNQAIVKTLESIGVDHVFGGSGQVNATMLLSLKRSDKIKTVIVRNEQGASFMACGYAMFSDKLGVCFATGGPGAFNLFSGMAVAYYDSLPVLGITGYTSAANRGKGALNESTGLNRTPDSHKMFSATTKKSYIIEDPDSTCDILEDAINTAFEGRPGPVHIHVPKNITVAEVKNFRQIKVDIKPVLSDVQKVKEAAELIARSLNNKEDILLLIGYGAIRSHAEGVLLKFVESFHIPFVTTMDAKGILSEDHPLALGVFGTSGDLGAKKYFDKAKLVIAVGNSFAQNATFAFKPDLYTGKTLIHINIDKNEINKVYKADCGIVSDAKAAIEALIDELKKLNPSVSPKKVKKEFWYDAPIDYSGNKIFPGEMVKIISRNLPENAIVMGDAGAHMLWLNCYLHLTKNQRYQNPGSFGPMASHVNGSIGVKCANPDKTVICGCGDGAYLMAGFELLTAVQYDIPVIWVIFNNGEFNVIKKFLINLFGEHAFMQFKNPDYVKYAEACGAQGWRVEKLEEFEPVFKKALSLGKPALIDVAVESEVYPPFSLAKV